MNTPLPIVKVPLKQLDPAWVGDYGPSGKEQCRNMDARYLPEELLDAEVLTLNLSTGKMRVRFLKPQYCHHSKSGFQALSIDVSIEHFFRQYNVVKNPTADLFLLGDIK